MLDAAATTPSNPFVAIVVDMVFPSATARCGTPRATFIYTPDVYRLTSQLDAVTGVAGPCPARWSGGRPSVRRQGPECLDLPAADALVREHNRHDHNGGRPPFRLRWAEGRPGNAVA